MDTTAYCDTLSIIGNWSSIVGLLLTIVIALIGYLINNRIKEIQRNIQFDVRIKNLIQQLDKSKSTYLKYFQDYANSINNIRFEVSQTEVILKNIKNKINGQEKKNINKLLKQVWRMKVGNFINEQDRKKGLWISIQALFIKRLETSEQDLWTFYTELSALQTQIENLAQDKKIKRYE